ncbi:Crp/Fnr family transcriptional regulator [Fulvivirga sediminis]|uniref:Cyclic nucleotide-binding domain-containing protein n=1 Tax=Fulvivirga sediminis TaxID=2803949 RepID=A0A937F4N7_9BACT|nr:cyclic nucleotide-binding domain-containing protein [Fulvivirga sediminis]MBL3656331.1 cyclic nucleotide-binding domain-containing protein [Fulvivirga sediminis]
MNNPFKKTFTPEQHDLFLYLSRINLFSTLNYKQMSLFLPFMYERKYEQDEVVFFRNDPSHALYLLKKGEIALTIDVNERFEDLTKVGPGVALGESCLLKNTKRLLNAFVVSEKAEFYVIPQDNIFDIFENNIKIKTRMLEVLAEVYNEYNSNVFKAYKSSMGFFNLSQVYRG